MRDIGKFLLNSPRSGFPESSREGRELPLQGYDVLASEGIRLDEEEWYRGNKIADCVFVSLLEQRDGSVFLFPHHA